MAHLCVFDIRPLALTQRKAVSMRAFFSIGYLVVGIVQLFAIMDGVAFATGFDGFVGFLIAIFTTYIPLLGAMLGIYGAVNVWDWSFLQAALIFFWYIPVGILLVMLDRK